MPKDNNIKKYQTGINKLIIWVRNKKWSVVINGQEDQLVYHTKTININIHCKIENRLYALLHECGHLLLFINKNYNKKYPYSYKIDFINPHISKKNLRKTKQYQVDIVAEELDAWRIGKVLSQRLKIYINNENYDKEMAKYVYTYMKNAIY